ncbi:MAG: hypothetical protein AB1641_07915 [Thermodesulfobacteriota bacterium]
MKLFDLSSQERQSLKKFLAWHLGYVGYVCIFSYLIYKLHLFKAYWFLKESWILNMVAPAHTIIFILISPYRRNWITALKNTYKALDGDPVFCFMALFIFLVGFYLYNGLIWGLGSLVPSIFFT